MNISDLLALAAILASSGTFIIQIVWQIKWNSKQKIFDGLYQIVYIQFPLKVDEILRKNSPQTEEIQTIKKFMTCEVINCFSIFRFRDKKKYNKIKNALNNLEDLICKIIETDDSFNTRKCIDEEITNFFKMVDKYFYIHK